MLTEHFFKLLPFHFQTIRVGWEQLLTSVTRNINELENQVSTKLFGMHPFMYFHSSCTRPSDSYEELEGHQPRNGGGLSQVLRAL